MRNRIFKYTALSLTLALACYVTAFFVTVGVVHVTYRPTIRPRPPQFLMYVSDTSTPANQTAHKIFAPLILLCESTGEFSYIDEAPQTGLDRYWLLPWLWKVLTA